MNSKMVEWTPLIPALGYLIIFSDELKNIFKLWVDASEAFEWRLYLIFLGLTSISISYIIYTIMCPSLIKRNSSKEDYTSKEIEHLSASDLFDLIEETRPIIRFQMDIHAGFNEKFDLLVNIENWGEEVVRSIRNDRQFSSNRLYVSEIMGFWFDYNDFRDKFSRILCLIFTSIGFVLLFIPSINVIIRVFMKISAEACKLITQIYLERILIL